MKREWDIKSTDIFDEWFDALNKADQEKIVGTLLLLRERGPTLSRPHVDTVKGSAFVNMKELRVQCNGDPIRVFFAFDPKRNGILLCAGNKTGDEKRFYEEMIPIADLMFKKHLERLK